jgi:hypothetical protein
VVNQVHLAHKAVQAQLDHRVLRVFRVHKDLKETKEIEEIRGQ